MRRITGETKIEIGLGTALLSALAFSGSLIGFVWLMLDGLRSDIAEARASIETVVKESSATAAKVQILDGGLNSNVGTIAEQYQLLSETLSENAVTLASLSTRVDISIARQQEFERFVISRITPASVDDIGTPPAWRSSEQSVLEGIKEGDSPLDNWQQFLLREGLLKEQ